MALTWNSAVYGHQNAYPPELTVCILYAWSVTMGGFVLKHAFQTEVDRNARQGLSIFRPRWDWLERRFTFDDPIPILFKPDFSLVSGR